MINYQHLIHRVQRDVSTAPAEDETVNPLGGYDRIHVAHLPTPLEPMDRLSRNLAGPHVYVKRDDCTGFITGGSSGRKLEFLMADAIAKRSTTIITAGSVRSDYTFQVIAIARRLDMNCAVVAVRETTGATNSGWNPVETWLNRVYGAEFHYLSPGDDLDAAVNQLGFRQAAEGRRIYAIPHGGSNAVGALGCVNLGIEIASQLREQRLRIDCVVLASDSGTTQAGLVVGFHLAGAPIRVLGVSVSAPKLKQQHAVYELVRDLSDLLQLERAPSQNNVVVNSDYVYNEQNGVDSDSLSAIAEIARQESILLTPGYTGKAMAALIDLIVNKRRFSSKENILFVHTDGSAGLLGYSAFLRTLPGSRNSA